MPELSKKVYPDGTEVTFKDTVAREQIATKRALIVSSSVIGGAVNIAAYDLQSSGYITPHEGFVRFTGASGYKVCLVLNGYSFMVSSDNTDYKGVWLPKGVKIQFDGTPSVANWFNCSNE